ncbi:MAG: VPDSG-CTERM sorting domain-containing protein [Verrucomicrobia bacterium]|nr:VPDSG-CTERM sorting domain-containing protein [Verrucomicrobiota bacterium]
MRKNILALVGVLFGATASVLGIPSNLGIDFRTAAWDNARGQSQDTVGGITMSAAFPLGSVLTWSSPAGIGINSPAPSGLATEDILSMTFSGGSGNGLTGAWVTDLFNGVIDESGVVLLTLASGATDTISFLGQQTASQDPLGDVYVNFGGPLDLVSAQFYGAGELNTMLSGQNYSVAGFTTVPDGGTTLMLAGFGLLSLIVFGKRFALERGQV